MASYEKIQRDKMKREIWSSKPTVLLCSRRGRAIPGPEREGMSMSAPQAARGMSKAAKCKPYRPRARIAGYLAGALNFVRSVPYDTTTRWTFYQMVQFAGLTKQDYGKFKSWTSRARKSFYGGWAPDTLVDDTRAIEQRGVGFDTAAEWLEQLKKESPYFDKINDQPNVVMVWFEARAMIGQFQYYTKPYHVPLVPFGGDPSIHFKWSIAKLIEALARRYPNKPIVVKYFGDFDPKGLTIPESALNDIEAWCGADFDFERVGLKMEHAERWNLPDNPEKPGQYQWEALPDEAAKELIVGALDPLIDLSSIRRVEGCEASIHERWREALDHLKLEGAAQEDAEK